MAITASKPATESKTTSDKPLWTPAAPEKTQLAEFMRRNGHESLDYEGFWRWSVDNTEDFWSALWDYAEIIGEKGDVVLEDGDKMPGARFFPHAKLNYAENLLRHSGPQPAIVFRDELGRERMITYDGLRRDVATWQAKFIEWGVRKGDRIAAYMPNMPETIIACLAATALGAVWSSASPDFGVQGLLDRFGQIEPKVLITVDGYFYGGKTLDCLDKVRIVAPQLKGLEQIAVVPFVSEAPRS